MRMLLIYGRRRVGKSELVKQALRRTEIKSIYYECRQVAEESNVQGICNVISENLGLPKLGYTSFEDILEYIFNMSKDEKIVFVLDEYPYLRENIIELIASPGARLENEVAMYLNAEISKIVNANEVFEALSRGFSKYSDILSQSHVSSGPILVDVLDKLMRMEVVEKKAPINDEENKKKAGYYICDNLSQFYYRYVFKYSSQMKIMDSDVFISRSGFEGNRVDGVEYMGLGEVYAC